jgi:hypothetical protein
MSLVQMLEAITRVNDDLFAIEFPGEIEVCFRLPTYKQAIQYASLIQLAGENAGLANVIYEYIFSSCVEDKYLGKHDMDIPGGIPTTVAKLILYLSGVAEEQLDYTNFLLHSYRANSTTLFNVMKRRICFIFSGYKFSDLEALNYQQLVDLYVQAEQEGIERGIIVEELYLEDDKEEERPKSIGEMIHNDAKEFNRFENESRGQNLKDNPEYQRRLQQYKQRIK